ncbi:nuclease-related domain-containing protein [Methyloterricola oryzae]|uniref:nuclease-related domain-containing protein n=1 Tax=Methyloterricola oryzae TaxID=1495050 RepID=UPI00069BDAAC|nr:nuclease-related domain-containing protein [Methyloterricola oryzae]
MIIKPTGDGKSVLAELEALRQSADRKRRRQIEEEIRIVRAGQKGESESAYFIDFDFAQSPDIAVIHDLRIEFNDRVAQIDHLLIHSSLACFVLETKHCYSGVKITESGEFLRWNHDQKNYEGMPSPLAQNQRHVAVLEDLFRSILNQDPWYSARPSFHPFILISPRARIDRPSQFDTTQVIKADLLGAALREILARPGETDFPAKIFSEEELQRFAKIVARHHKPLVFNYARKFGMESKRELKVGHNRPFDPVTPSPRRDKPCRSRRSPLLPSVVGLASLGALILFWPQYSPWLQNWMTKSFNTILSPQHVPVRQTPKSQSAGTKAMDEHAITIGDQNGNPVPVIQGNLSKIRQEMQRSGLGTGQLSQETAPENQAMEGCDPKPVMSDAEIQACRRARPGR